MLRAAFSFVMNRRAYWIIQSGDVDEQAGRSKHRIKVNNRQHPARAG
jgi:hypothetical protein